MSAVRAVDLATVDSDGDGIPNLCDNCSSTPNSGQHDSDRDGYGNACDADLNNDRKVDTLDSTLFNSAFGRTGDHLDTDFDANYVVDSSDTAIFNSLFGRPPGPAFGNTARP
jgi:hypothetical protein